MQNNSLLISHALICQDSSAALALDPDDRYAIVTKPHGHGDVHALMHSSGTAEKWKQAGCKWVIFMQVR